MLCHLNYSHLNNLRGVFVRQQMQLIQLGAYCELHWLQMDVLDCYYCSFLQMGTNNMINIW